MRKTILCLLALAIVGCGTGVETFSVTPRLVSNDCSFAVEQQPTRQIVVENDLFDFGWHEIERIDRVTNYGGRFKARHALHSTPEGFELLIVETIEFNGKVCDSFYMGTLL